MNNRLWIIPNNDLESNTILELLKKCGEEYLITKQQWGASWENLEDEIKKEIDKAKNEQKIVYGVELQGNSNGVINIDHHFYGEEDRGNSLSSIEQVAKVLNVKLNIYEQFVSANDKGYILEMKALGKKLGYGEKRIKKIIELIRVRDRKFQGITQEQEEQAKEAIRKLGDIPEKREYIQLDLPHSRVQTVQDRLYDKYYNLLITSEDGETNFDGLAEIVNMLRKRFPGGWSGGPLDKGRGFWGICNADQNAIKKAIDEALQKDKKTAVER